MANDELVERSLVLEVVLRSLSLGVNRELDDCATRRPLDEGRGKLCGLHLAVHAEVKHSARAGER